MRKALLPLLAAALTLAGCFGSTDSSTSSSTSNGPSARGWTLDCGLGAMSRSSNATWAQDCEARASHTAGSKTEMWLGVNPTDPQNVVVAAKDLNPESSDQCVWNGVFVTHDGGRTWKDVVIGGRFADRQPTDPTYGYACNTDPDFRFAANGDLHYGVEMYDFGARGSNVGYKILLATSHDGGDTWPQLITYQPDILVTTDFSRMIVVPTTQTILEAIGSYGGVGCNILRSDDGGQTATFTPVVTKDGVPCGSGGDTSIAASPDGIVVEVGGISTGGNQPVVVRSTDDGLTWVDSNLGFDYAPIGQFPESKYRSTGTIELAYDLSNSTLRGTLYACYPDGARDGGDIHVRASRDDGRTWDAPVLVNKDPRGAHQWMCNIAVAGDGSVHAFYMDKQFDPKHKFIDISHAWSTDGGRNWTTERVSTVPYDGDLGVHQDGFPFIGDYLGVDCAGRDCWAGFPDASDGNVPVAAVAHVHLA